MVMRAILATAFVTALAASFGAYSAAGGSPPSGSEKCMSETKDMKCISDMKGMSEMKDMQTMQDAKSTSKSASEKPRKLTAAQDRSKHFHPRDGK
jgi:hypothetical protein